MKAAVLMNNGDDKLAVVDDLEVLEPGPGEVSVQIMATGVCHSDLSCINGTIPQPAPAVLGHEGAGVVTAVGSEVSRLHLGDHVIIAWGVPCGVCVNCVDRRAPQLCTTMYRTGALDPRFRLGVTPVNAMNGVGTFSQFTTVQEGAAVRIDEDVPFGVASLIGCGVTTGVDVVVNRAKVTPGSSVVVFGCGGGPPASSAPVARATRSPSALLRSSSTKRPSSAATTAPRTSAAISTDSFDSGEPDDSIWKA